MNKFGLALSCFLLGTCLQFPSSSYYDATQCNVAPKCPPPVVKAAAPVPSKAFSFAVISDTHDKSYCGLGQGYTPAAIRLINKLNPAFVVGVGDLVAGGGDCKRVGGPNLIRQLEEFKHRVLMKLKVPFVPLTGNHDMESALSLDKDYATKVWKKFWAANQKYLLPQLRFKNNLCSQRFVYKGIGFSLITYYNTYGLTHHELNWIRRNVQKGDFVFRHINPYGLSCVNFIICGFAMRTNGPVKNLYTLTDLLKRKKVRALFSGHSHAFYDGDCDGLRFINTGSTGRRSMEYLIGWGRSPYKNKQAFVWVDVDESGSFKVSFYVWNESTFVKFDKRHFPAVIKAKTKNRWIFKEGVKAMCRAHR